MKIDGIPCISTPIPESVSKLIKSFFGILWRVWKKTLDKNLRLSKSPQKRRIVYLIINFFLVLAIFLSLLIIKNFAKVTAPITNFFVSDFGKSAATDLFAIILICFFTFYFLFYLLLIIDAILGFLFPWLVFLIIALTFSVFLIGFVFIHHTVGNPDTEWLLRNETGSTTEKIVCETIRGELIYGERINCKIKNPLFYNQRGWIMLESANGSVVQKDSLSFVAAEDIYHIRISMEATKNEETQKFSTGFHPKFETREESIKRKDSLITYFIGLLFVCLITVPQIVLKYFKLKHKKITPFSTSPTTPQ